MTEFSGKHSLAKALDAFAGGALAREDYLLERFAALSGQRELNAFISQCSEADVYDYIDNFIAAKPLAGIPFSVKDNILATGFPTTAGGALLRDFRPGQDAHIVGQLRAAGGFLLGKNNLSEYCQGITCNNATYGPVKNPVNKDWIAGGSSGGSAAAVAAGIVPFAIGSDTGGSVRIPAALCGCVGYRPTTGRYSTDGFIPVSPSFDAPGIIAGGVEDIQVLDQILTTHTPLPDTGLESLRVGLPVAHFFDSLEAELGQVIDRAIDTLAEMGCILVELDLTEALALNQGVGYPVACYEMLREMAVFFARQGIRASIADIVANVAGPVEKAALEAQIYSDAIDRAQYLAALQNNWGAFVGLIDDLYARQQLDVIAFPTTPIAALERRPLGEDAVFDFQGKEHSVFLAYTRNTEPFSNYGGPCITVPAGRTVSGKPVGLELAGVKGKDEKLMLIARSVESALES